MQTADGLGVDGIAGPQTLARLADQRTRESPCRPLASGRLAPAGQSPGASTALAAASRSPAAWACCGAWEAAAGGHSTSSRSIGLLVLLIALAVAVGLAAIWIARRRRAIRNAGIGAAINRGSRSAPADTVRRRSQPDHNPQPTAAVAIPDLAAIDDADRAFRQALVLEERGDQSGAIAAYRQADQLGHGLAACNLGALLAQGGEMAAAEASFRRAAERGDVHGAFNLAVLHEQRGDLTGAIAAYQQAERLGHGSAACNLGVLLEQQGELAAAEASFRRAAERGDAAGAFNLGVLLEGQGDRTGALRAYEQAERIEGTAATADMARAAARELRSQIENPITARKGGAHNGR